MSRHQSSDAYTDYVQLIPLRARADDDEAPVNGGIKALSSAIVRRHGLFLTVVFLPTLLAVIYFGLIVADRYSVEAQFVVRSPSRANVDQLSTLIQSSGVTRASDESNAVHEFIKSRDAVHLLLSTADLRALLSRPEADAFWRFPGWFTRDLQEKLFEHYLNFVAIGSDQTTGISTLTVQAFRGDDAVKLAQALLDGSEKLINRLNERARRDTVSVASAEVEASKKVAYDAREKLTAFRTRAGLVDPSKTSASLLETIGKLSLEAAQANAELSEVQRSSPQGPQVAALRNKIAAIEAQVVQERLRIGGTNEALAPLLAEYERLILEREFADRAFSSALTSLEAARIDAQRQQLYLERVVEPRVPDYPRQPQRLLSILIAFGCCLAVYSILRALLANARSHQPR